jgi:hypothetical protein
MELARSDWRDLPKLAASGYNRKPDLVVCTHLDRVSGENLQQRLWTVSRSFWPGIHDESDRVLKCSSLMGLSAQQLLEQAKATKPSFKEVWESTSIRYHVGRGQFIESHRSLLCFLCSVLRRSLEKDKPELVYNDYDRDLWVGMVEEQLNISGLPRVIHKLTRELVDSARKNALTGETAEAIRLVRELRKKEG